MNRRLALVLVALLAAASLWFWRPWHTADAAPKYRLGAVERGALSDRKSVV